MQLPRAPKMKIKNIYSESTRCFCLTESRQTLIPELDKLAKANKISAMIIGAAAMPKYNYIRSTEDIDIITTADDAYKFGDLLNATGQFEFIGHSKFKHVKTGLDVNFCPEGVKAGDTTFPKQETNAPGLNYVSLPLLLALKIKAKRLRDRADYVELIKRNHLDLEYINENVLPLLNKTDAKWAITFWNKAQKEL